MLSHPFSLNHSDNLAFYSRFIIDSYIDLYAMDLVYTGSWHEGGSSLSGKAGTGDGYVELYNTTAWDVMLQVLHAVKFCLDQQDFA